MIQRWDLGTIANTGQKTMYKEANGRFVKLEDHLSELAAKDDIIKEVEKEARKVRLILLLNHGHKGQYLDDGEMQCGECGVSEYDFKIPPLSELTKRILSLLQSELVRLKEEHGREAEALKTRLDHQSTVEIDGALYFVDKPVAEYAAALRAERDELKVALRRITTENVHTYMTAIRPEDQLRRIAEEALNK
ncbi:MAG: hypothetical protein WAZ60_23885 [Desulfosalsimonadaceae bacterium]